MIDAQTAAEQQQDTPLFVCVECGEPVVVYGGYFFHTCEHVNSMVVATRDGLKAVGNGI